MNNIASLIPFGTLRRSLKRDPNDNQNEQTSDQQVQSSSNHQPHQLYQAKRSASAKRLPFSTIKSNVPQATNDIAELPPSPKLLDEGISAKHTHHQYLHHSPYRGGSSNYVAVRGSSGSSGSPDEQAATSFVRSSHKTYSFHTYRRRPLRYISHSFGSILNLWEILNHFYYY